VFDEAYGSEIVYKCRNRRRRGDPLKKGAQLCCAPTNPKRRQAKERTTSENRPYKGPG